MTQKELAKIMGGRILESFYDYAHVSNLVYEALDFGLECIQLFPNMIAKAREIANGRDVNICSVISYPHGVFLPEQKAFEIKNAKSLGADQFEVAIDNINVRSGNWQGVRDEFKACRKAAGDDVLKTIIECEFIDDDMMKKVCGIAADEGVDRIVTSIGVYTRPDEQKRDVLVGAEAADVRKLKEYAGDKIKITAQGNIDTYEKCIEMLDAGADYISSEYAADILRSMR